MTTVKNPIPDMPTAPHPGVWHGTANCRCLILPTAPNAIVAEPKPTPTTTTVPYVIWGCKKIYTTRQALSKLGLKNRQKIEYTQVLGVLIQNLLQEETQSADIQAPNASRRAAKLRNRASKAARLNGIDRGKI